jgi:SsrA-binding protein
VKIITDNKKARFDYFLLDKYEAGIELFGWEVKSARAGAVNLQDSFVFVDGGEAFLKNAHFSPFEYGDTKTQEVRRSRRLLLKKTEIQKILSGVEKKGNTAVATKMYFNDRGFIKVEVALARGKQNFDKKQTLKERDILREAQSDASHAR